MQVHKIKILSFDPGTKHIGFASFSGTNLTDSGVKTVRQGSEKIILEHISKIVSRMIEEKQPDYLVLEKNNFSQITQNVRLTRSIASMKIIAKTIGILTYEFDLRTIRKEICNDGNANKLRTAEVLITYFPELSIFLKCKEKHVFRYYMNMFDAVAVGLTFVKQHISSTLPIQRNNLRKL